MNEQRGRKAFEGYHIKEDDEVEKALIQYKAADEKLWELTSKYLYPPEEVPHEGTRELVFPSSAAQNEYNEVSRQAQAARERYERIAHEKQSHGQEGEDKSA
ncbi:MAG: hypothetical protein ACOC9B_00905 [Chloroflexota bacterium]